MIIDINNQHNVEVKLYPDNQPHIKLPAIEPGQNIRVNCALKNSINVLQLLEVADAIDSANGVKHELHIPYLMGARFDRVMEPGDSFDLRVLAKLINMCEFQNVYLYDVHSDVAPALIKNARLINNDKLVARYKQEKAVLICPDAGAAKKISHYLDINKTIVDVVYCIKHRDLSNGQLQLTVLEPQKCYDRNCVIIDDLCDGGGTFLAIASQITPRDLTLIVTHGLFTQGFNALEQRFHKIITSNTYHGNYNSKIVEVLPWTNF